MRRSKEEQLIRSMQIIEEQAKELVEVYGWDKEHVKDIEASLKRHAKKEVEYWHDTEDCSGSWNLARWVCSTHIHLGHDFRELEDIDTNRMYELRGLAYELSDLFEYIENISIEKLDMIAQYKDDKSVFALKAVDGTYLAWDLEQIEDAIKTQRLTKFEAVKKLYNALIDKNKELSETKEQ